ncbi:MAG TPA: hypothetical protein PK581_07590 [Caldisericia bacterium]|jgi:predicted DNA-binding protein|nr:hypothetical protein [Caldisericia bacterium]
MAKNTKNYTFSLPVELMDKVKSYAEIDENPSINTMVREAVEYYVLKMNKAWLQQEMQKAAADPLFMEDLQACMKDFEAVDDEVLPEPAKR